VACLDTLIGAGYEIAAVVSQPDRPQGRKKLLVPTPVKALALTRGIPVLQPERLRHSDAVDELRRIAPDLIVTAAYGQILPKTVLEIPRFGCINVHASLLPKYRGGAPIQHAVRNGEKKTGVTIMYMAEGMDTGDMISKVEVEIGRDDTSGSMFIKLAQAGAQLLLTTLPKLISGVVNAVPQPHEEATYAPNLKREDERINWTQPSEAIYNLVRSLLPEPGAFTMWSGNVLKVRGCADPSDDREWGVESAVSNPAPAKRTSINQPAPGTVLALSERGIEVVTGDGRLRVTKVQPAGKSAMDAGAFVRGGQMKVGDKLGEG
ncbi:MAG: methionyl-tRNA formyltransferase, partial [Paenibacillaceae bacterium]|nr:methionyl-tRNA formyltransferase [Paenibacillaceae bacterium]